MKTIWWIVIIVVVAVVAIFITDYAMKKQAEKKIPLPPDTTTGGYVNKAAKTRCSSDQYWDPTEGCVMKQSDVAIR